MEHCRGSYIQQWTVNNDITCTIRKLTYKNDIESF